MIFAPPALTPKMLERLKKNKHLFKERNLQITRRILQGESISSVAQDVGLSHSRVCQITREMIQGLHYYCLTPEDRALYYNISVATNRRADRRDHWLALMRTIAEL